MMNQPGRRPLDGRPFWTSPERPDGQSAPACQSRTSLSAFDEMFKSNFVFSVKYHDALSSLYTFLQTAMYRIDISTTEETPKVK